MVTDTPTNLTITSVSSPNFAALPCTIPSLAGGSSEVIVATAIVDGVGDFLNTASATADEPDGNLANNNDNGTDRNNGGFIRAAAVPPDLSGRYF
jgi:hypothetical protein